MPGEVLGLGVGGKEKVREREDSVPGEGLCWAKKPVPWGSQCLIEEASAGGKSKCWG